MREMDTRPDLTATRVGLLLKAKIKTLTLNSTIRTMTSTIFLENM
jgi:hypothetical protein